MLASHPASHFILHHVHGATPDSPRAPPRAHAPVAVLTARKRRAKGRPRPRPLKHSLSGQFTPLRQDPHLRTDHPPESLWQLDISQTTHRTNICALPEQNGTTRPSKQSASTAEMARVGHAYQPAGWFQCCRALGMLVKTWEHTATAPSRAHPPPMLASHPAAHFITILGTALHGTTPESQRAPPRAHAPEAVLTARKR